MSFLSFLRLSMSEPDKTPSSKRVISYLVVLIYSSILLGAFFLGFTITDPILHMADMLLSAGLGTYVIGRYAEYKNQPVKEEVKKNPEPVKTLAKSEDEDKS